MNIALVYGVISDREHVLLLGIFIYLLNCCHHCMCKIINLFIFNQYRQNLFYNIKSGNFLNVFWDFSPPLFVC